MNCKNCGAETNGIKINGRLFCTNCGEAIEAAAQTPVPTQTPTVTPENIEVLDPLKTLEPTPKLIHENGEVEKLEKEIATLEAEEEVLDAIAQLKPTKHKAVKIKNAEIKKHNRPRIIRAGKNAFKVYAGEPDPVSEPELEVPHDDLLAPESEPTEEAHFDLANPGEAPGHALLEDKVRNNIEEKRKNHQKVFVNFLKSGTTQATNVKKKKEHKGKTKLVLTIMTVIIVIAGGIGVTVYYMNNFGFNTTRQIEAAEKAAGLGDVRPKYIPAGYELSFLTKGEAGKINYVYEYAADDSKTIEIKVAKTEINPVDLYDQKVKPEQTDFFETTIKSTDVWQVGKTKLFFINDAKLYQVISSDELSEETFQKIAEGLI